jgi:SH3-like domain-containing protein
VPRKLRTTRYSRKLPRSSHLFYPSRKGKCFRIVRRLGPSRFNLFLLAALAAAVVIFPACGRGRHHVLEVAYVSVPQAALRDQVAAVYNRVGTVKNGDRVEVLERERRFARVRTSGGVEGWIEDHDLVDQKTFDEVEQLMKDNQSDPVEAPGVLRNDTNLHIAPGRETEHLYQLASGAKVSILKRATAEKQIAMPPPKPEVVGTAKAGAKNPAAPYLEDWWLVRDENGRVGWVLARMVDVDVPLDIAQYAEGQRFVAFFKLDEVTDGDKQVPQYLCVLTEPHDGLPYDFDQIRVFTWNTRKHRYETAYREHGLNGVLPVTVTQENFDKEGVLPVFILRVKDDAGNVSERKYKLNTPIVRRVLAPGEVPTIPAKKRRR